MEIRPVALARYGPLREWNTERVQNFSEAFVFGMHERLSSYRFPGGQGAGEDDDITGWNTSAASDMSCMFLGCTTFNQPLRFDTHAVTDMSCMFERCTAFNQPLPFNTGACQSFGLMFGECTAFNQPLNFDTHNVREYNSMFFRCIAFNQPLHHWYRQPSRYRGIRLMWAMFEGCVSFKGPVFKMSVAEYDQSELPLTPLGQSAVMQEALMRAGRVIDPAEQGRIISKASREAALVLGAPVHNPELAALREQYAYEYRYRPERDDDMYLPRDDDAVNRARDDDDDDGRNVRPRLQ